ncbi:MAG: toprim domain-containing protein [Tannerella sp.]|jgi:hypothetical protein|nr:toprim domain-containing protein [Tannerella sp.]
MTPNQANSISIRDFLAGMDIHPKKGKSYYGMYFSPFRAETAPSFKVDFNKNLWYDFGSGEGGTMVDLAMKLYGCTFHEAMKRLESGGTPSVILPAMPAPRKNKIILGKVLPLTGRALTGYLSLRGINPDTARRQCVEAHYEVNGNKHCYAVGFRNDAGGYELRNRYFKGCISPKHITTFSLPTDDCMIFEGFMDYLSFLTLNGQLQPQTDTVVLNSTACLQKAMHFLNRHSLVHSYLDNDRAGRQALSEIMEQHGRIDDMSILYEQYKDLNEYLVSQLNYELKA